MMNGKRKNAPHLETQSTAPHDELIVLVGAQAWNAYGTKATKNSGKSEEWLLLAQALNIKPKEKPVILGGTQLDEINKLKIAPEGKKIARLCQFGALSDIQLGGIVANFARYSDVETLTLCDNLGQLKDNLTDWLKRTRDDEQTLNLMAKAADTGKRANNDPYVELRDDGYLKGLFYIKPKFDNDTHEKISEKASWICDPLQMVGLGKNDEGGYFYVFQWKNSDEKKPRTEAIACGDFGTETAWRALKNQGLKMTPKTGLAQMLVEYFHAQSATAPKYRVTSATGWHDGAYLLPSGEIIGQPNKAIIFKNKSANAAGYGTAGTLESWQRGIAANIKGNPSMMLGVAVALAAPLVRLLDAESFGVHLYNSSSKGKTTTLNIANSVYGDPSLIKSSWNTTSTAINNEAEARNDGLITLDEMGQSKKPYEVENIAYSLFNETGRLRGQKEGGNVDLSRWKICALSTGEKDLESYLLSKGIQVNAGQLVRLLNIPLIEAAELHGFDSNKAHADHLNDAAKANYGIIGRE